MTTVQNTATLAEKTVQKVAAGTVKPPKKRKSGSSKTRATEGRRITVNPDVWSTALTLSGGAVTRIEVRTETEVVVHNNPNWRKSK
jgi:hypothetical protein